MAPKKTPHVSPIEVEVEIAQLSGEAPVPPNPPSELQSLQSMFADFLQKQDSREEKLYGSLTSSMNDIRSLVSRPSAPQQPSTGAACPSRVLPASKDLFTVSYIQFHLLMLFAFFFNNMLAFFAAFFHK